MRSVCIPRLALSFCEFASSLNMTRTLLYFLVILFFSFSVDCGSRTESNTSKENYPKSASTPTGKASGGGLGAWGYMAIILTLIGLGAGIYYLTLFYPILCKKERKYDVMELSSV